VLTVNVKASAFSFIATQINVLSLDLVRAASDEATLNSYFDVRKRL
jgi:hypothetical protein